MPSPKPAERIPELLIFGIGFFVFWPAASTRRFYSFP
jgi:fucose permease